MGFTIRARDPFDLALSLRAASSFTGGEAPTVLRIATRVKRRPIVIEVRQARISPPVLQVTSASGKREEVRSIAAFVLHVDLDLTPFYRITSSDSRLGPIAKELWGLRPFRPASLFEMLVTAITEQQISMRVAEVMRERLTARFGAVLDGTPFFPDERSLAKATPASLVRCGLSRRKAEYVHGISKMITEGKLDLDAVKGMSDEEAFGSLTKIRGVGPWTADYVLVRGLGRVDRVPVEDLGIRGVVGKYLGEGTRIKDPDEVLPLLEPFAPFRGLAAYYLLVYDRLKSASRT